MNGCRTVIWYGPCRGRMVRLAVRMCAEPDVGVAPWVVSWLGFDLSGRRVNVSPADVEILLPQLRRLYDSEEVSCSR